jgi:riboflavin kinase/FMN adenylyltransferase
MPALYRHLGDLPRPLRGGVVSIGNFDGVHAGHARIVARLVEMARSLAVPAVVLTFDPHPARLLRPEQAPMPLSWTDYKARLLCELGVAAVVAYPTDDALLQLTASEFFQNIVQGQLQARGMVEGQNFFFGHDRGGDIVLLARFCADADIRLDVVEPALVDGLIVSSSRVRELVAAGDVAGAARLLNRPYRICGAVIHGQGRGDRLGYPTANVGGIDMLLPGQGIYAGRALIDGQSHAAAMSLGSNPTFDESELKVEAFLLDYAGDLYDRAIEIDFLARLRDIQRFDSVDRLVEQIALDVQHTRQIAGERCDMAHVPNTR